MMYMYVHVYIYIYIYIYNLPPPNITPPPFVLHALVNIEAVEAWDLGVIHI